MPSSFSLAIRASFSETTTHVRISRALRPRRPGRRAGAYPSAPASTPRSPASTAPPSRGLPPRSGCTRAESGVTSREHARVSATNVLLIHVTAGVGLYPKGTCRPAQGTGAASQGAGPQAQRTQSLRRVGVRPAEEPTQSSELRHAVRGKRHVCWGRARRTNMPGNELREPLRPLQRHDVRGARGRRRTTRRVGMGPAPGPRGWPRGSTEPRSPCRSPGRRCR